MHTFRHSPASAASLLRALVVAPRTTPASAARPSIPNVNRPYYHRFPRNSSGASVHVLNSTGELVLHRRHTDESRVGLALNVDPGQTRWSQVRRTGLWWG